MGDEKSAGNSRPSEVSELENSKEECEGLNQTNMEEHDSLRLASAEACALALCQAAEPVDSGDSDVPDADIITRVDVICKKYDKYDLDKQKQVNIASGASDDAFLRLYAAVDADLHQLVQKGETVALETRRATAVAVNAEIRRSKARLLEDIPKLQRLAFKKVKGLSKEELEARSELVIALKERIEAVPDGSTVATKQTGGFTASGSNAGFVFDSTSDGKFDSDYFQHTEDTNAFRQEYEMRKMKQDEGLDDIAEGLHTLKNMAHDMNEELDRQVPLMDEIDDKVDRANSELRNTNVQLKDTITKLRSSRNFCCDVILLCIILGIAAYLYNVLK